MLGNGLPNRQDGFCFHRAPGFHTREQMSTDHFILFYRFFCFSIKYVPILDILVFGPLKTFFFFFSSRVIPSYWSSEKWLILREETKD